MFTIQCHAKLHQVINPFPQVANEITISERNTQLKDDNVPISFYNSTFYKVPSVYNIKFQVSSSDDFKEHRLKCVYSCRVL